MSISPAELNGTGASSPRTGSGAASPTSPRSRPQSPGLLSRFGLAQPTLEVSPLAQETFFLHPNPQVGAPTHDETFTGHIRLWLPKSRILKNLTVTLVGQYDIGWPDSRPFETGKLLERTVSLVQGGEGLKLEKGEHTFEFIFVLPDNSAYYTRCRYGRVRHYITATAYGLSMTGGDMVSNEKPVYLYPNPGLQEPSRPPPALDLKFEGHQEDVGVYKLALQSQNIMIAGLLLLRLSLVSPPNDVFIFSVRVKILQQFTLRSPKDQHSCSPPPAPQTVMILDAAHPANNAKMQDDGRGDQTSTAPSREAPLKALRKGQAWNLVHLARLPNDNHLRPSSPDGTDTPIAAHHTLQIEITYRQMTGDESDPTPLSPKGKEREKQPNPELKTLIMSKPFVLWSCCCFLDSLTLPVYAEFDTFTCVEAGTEASMHPCLCRMPLKHLIETQANSLLKENDFLAVEYVPTAKAEGSSTSLPPSSPATPTIDRPPAIRQASDTASPIMPVQEVDRGRPSPQVLAFHHPQN
ncbi:hypothetical protein JCM11251_001551 [Rhodosporidiobolus azoricus]